MKHGSDHDRYLKKRGDKWHYYRRVPKRLSVLDPRGTIRQSLKTDNVEEARLRRDQLAEADDNLWASLSIAEIEDDGPAAVNAARRRYQVAAIRAMNAGFRYVQMDELASTAELVDRLLAPARKIREPKNGVARNEEPFDRHLHRSHRRHPHR